MDEKGVSDFIKYAYQKRRVKNAEEAFEEYPVHEEWHKGKIENILNENSEEYCIYNVGDIVFVTKYYYENGKEGKNHLFVIIDQNNLAVPIERFGMLISSKISKVKYKSNKLLKKDQKNKLRTDSIVKTDMLYRISNDQILFKVGYVDKEKVSEYKKAFIDLD